MDVVTTSGPGTGQAAHVEKIRTMKAALGDFPLAIASGITPENVKDYLPFSDCYLVATGISDSFEELNPDRVRALVNTVQAWDESNERQQERAGDGDKPRA
jgi:predicted TIM-barrel enzyme